MKKTTKILFAAILAVSTFTTYAQTAKGNYYLSISHEVSDYAKWQVIFDNFNNDRKEVGIIDLFVKQNINNTNSITVFSKITDLEKAKDFMSSPTLKEAMASAGVTTKPEIIFYQSVKKYAPIQTSTLITTISHSVSNFSTWKNTYDAAEELRNNAGITDHLLLISISDRNQVTILGSSFSTEKFQKFMANPKLKETMEKAGVTSRPEVKMLF